MAELTSEQVTALLEQHIATGTKEDAIFTDLSAKTGKGLLSCIAMYRKFMKATGRILTVAQRKEKAASIVKGALVENKILDLNALIAEVGKQLDIAPTSAIINIKAVCAANGIVVPVREQPIIGEVNNYLIQNPNLTREQFVIWMSARSKTPGNIASYWAKFSFCKACFKAWS